VYVAQVEDDRLDEVTQSGRYLDATREFCASTTASGFTMILRHLAASRLNEFKVFSDEADTGSV
jgi:hypothetical protein